MALSAYLLTPIGSAISSPIRFVIVERGTEQFQEKMNGS